MPAKHLFNFTPPLRNGQDDALIREESTQENVLEHFLNEINIV